VRPILAVACVALTACGSTCSGDNHVEGTVDPPGKIDAFDPSGALPKVSAFAGAGAGG
jgi:hypothetical protein